LADHASGKGKSRKNRVPFRRNRQQPARRKQWTAADQDDAKVDLLQSARESVRAKGDLSRKRTIVQEDQTSAGPVAEGTVVAVRGQFVDVDDGQQLWPCTVRRILRTRSIEDRSPVVVGDRVTFHKVAETTGRIEEGVIEQVHPRQTALKRCDGRRTHVIAANVDQVIVVQSIREPKFKKHLFDRYLVAAHAGGLDAAVCVNKIDLDPGGETEAIVEKYQRLGYRALATSAAAGLGLDALRQAMAGKVTLMAGQSGVGKSTLRNALHPGLRLPTAPVSGTSEKGRHTTTTAVWLKLDFGGAVVDTPGIRALDVAMIPLNELETHFVEFVDRVRHCKFPNCVHIHEEGCAILAALDADEIDPDRYDSYVELFYELSETSRRQREQPGYRTD